VTVVTENLFVRGQPYRMLRVREHGPFCNLGADSETLLQTTVAGDITLTSSVSRQQSKTLLHIFASTCCLATALEGNGEEFDI
jgi:hypothetical protein